MTTIILCTILDPSSIHCQLIVFFQLPIFIIRNTINMTLPLAGDALAIGVGAFFGAMSRHQAGRVAADWIAKDPNTLGRYSGWNTAAINVGGSFILGGVVGSPVVLPSQKTLPTGFGLTPRQKLLLGVGFSGSFTTFSTYSTDVVAWLAKGETTKAMSYIMVNNVGGIVAAATGLALVKKYFGKL
jgi:CrcB protein